MRSPFIVRMTTIASLLTATCVLSVATIPGAPAAESSPKVVLTEAVAKPLKDAQQAIAKANWNAARGEIGKAQTVANKTPQDVYTIDTLLGYVLYKEKKYADAAVVYERLLSSSLLPAQEAPERMKAVADMYFHAGEYSKAVKWSNQYLETASGRADADALALTGNAYFRMKDFKNAAATMRKATAAVERENRKPPEAWLRVVSNSCFESGDESCVVNSLKQLARLYQKPEDWSAFLDRAARDEQDRRVQFGYRELKFDLGVLKGASDYEEAVFAALDAKLPLDAERMLERGKPFLTAPGAPAGHYERLKEAVEKQVTESRAQLGKLERDAAHTEGGKDDVLLGRKYLSNGEYDRAIQSLKRGIAAGGLDDTDNARISLGIAYLKRGQKDLAAQAFNAIKKDSKWRELAELWTLRTEQGSPPVKVGLNPQLLQHRVA